MTDQISYFSVDMRERNSRGESVCEILNTGAVIDNAPIFGRRKPNGVEVVKCRMK